MNFLFYALLVLFLISSIFFFFSHSTKFENFSLSSFECGFNSYFFSRYCFSMHYYIVGLIFLFLDLEICFLMSFFNENFSNFFSYIIVGFFVFFLIMSVVFEWTKGKLDWKFWA